MNTSQCPTCLSTNVGPDDPSDENIVCHECGIWWDPRHPNNQPGAPAFGREIQPGDMNYIAYQEED
jgi:transcription initiation factor TFIIIB Brf1 subunit/transcription initiation factor TFIIB